jgi:dipeptidyl aminopeptidase/acylaminoacyl peptidase
MKRFPIWLVPVAFAVLPLVALAAEQLAFTPADLDREAALSEPAISPDGRWVVYTVATVDHERDEFQSELWRAAFDGSGRMQLTSRGDNSNAEWSADGRSIVYLSDRKPKGTEIDADGRMQVWLMAGDGRDAHRVTDFPGGVHEFALSPDGTRLAVIAEDPERPPGAAKPKNPLPFVTDRYLFKDDDTGWLGARHRHLYVVDLKSGKATLLTPGPHDEELPSWSPDGLRIAYVTRRGDDQPRATVNHQIFVIDAHAGATEQALTEGKYDDCDPYWGSRPSWSPDGKRIAFLRGGAMKWVDYAPWQLAVLDLATGQVAIPSTIGLNFTSPTWSADGHRIYALIEYPEVTHLAAIDPDSGQITELTRGERFDVGFSVAGDGRVALLSGDNLHPYRLFALGNGGLRVLDDHNPWLAGRKLASTETLQFRNREGIRIDALLMKPSGYVPGKRYPMIVRVHGGPYYQFSNEFHDDWQVYAAEGYAVLAVNPRGSSGRGFDFARAIYANWGGPDGRDVLAAVDHVVQMGIADPDRLGVGGWSYGAILTDELIARSQRFKAAIAGAGTGNIYGMFGDDEYIGSYLVELGTPWDHRATWDRVSYPFLHASRIKTPTLFECDGIDFNVPCIGSEQMYQALRVLGTPTQFVRYPDQHHEISVPSYLMDRMQRNLAWYNRFLHPERGTP